MGYLYLAISKFCGAAQNGCDEKLRQCGRFDGYERKGQRRPVGYHSRRKRYSVRRKSRGNRGRSVDCGVKRRFKRSEYAQMARVRNRRFALVSSNVRYDRVRSCFRLRCRRFYTRAKPVSATQWAGAGVILAAVVLFCVGRDVKFGKKGIVWIAVCTLSSAGCNVTAKLYAVRAGSEYVAFFNLVTFVIVFTFFAVVAAITVLKNRKKTDSAADSGPVEYSGRAADSGHAEEKDPQPREFFGLPKRTYFRIAIAAVGMYATNYFMTLAAGALPSGVLYPLSYGAGFVLTAIMDTVFFKQKLTLPRAVATVLAVAGAVLTAL